MSARGQLNPLLESIRQYLTCYLVSHQDAAPFTTGATSITIDAAHLYADGEHALIYDESGSEAYEVEVMRQSDTVLQFGPAIPVDMASPQIEKVYNGRTIQGIFVGEPKVIPAYPAITIHGAFTDEPLASSALYYRTFDIQIIVWTDGEDYEAATALGGKIASTIEQVLGLVISVDESRLSISESQVLGIRQYDLPDGDSTLKMSVVYYRCKETIQKFIRSAIVADALAL